jgi:hypothetical protein
VRRGELPVISLRGESGQFVMSAEVIGMERERPGPLLDSLGERTVDILESPLCRFA